MRGLQWVTPLLCFCNTVALIDNPFSLMVRGFFLCERDTQNGVTCVWKKLLSCSAWTEHGEGDVDKRGPVMTHIDCAVFIFCVYFLPRTSFRTKGLLQDKHTRDAIVYFPWNKLNCCWTTTYLSNNEFTLTLRCQNVIFVNTTHLHQSDWNLNLSCAYICIFIFAFTGHN